MKAQFHRSQLESRVAGTEGSRSCRPSHRIVEHNVLFGKLQQHRIVEELADAHIFTQALWRMEPGTRVSSTGGVIVWGEGEEG